MNILAPTSVLWQKAASGFFERWLRIQTTGKVGPINREAIHYTPLPYNMVMRMLRVLAPNQNDVLVDVGSGKGRVVCCAARLNMKKVVGVELDEALVSEARQNLLHLRGRKSEAEIVHVSAENYKFDDAT